MQYKYMILCAFLLIHNYTHTTQIEEVSNTEQHDSIKKLYNEHEVYRDYLDELKLYLDELNKKRHARGKSEPQRAPGQIEFSAAVLTAYETGDLGPAKIVLRAHPNKNALELLEPIGFSKEVKEALELEDLWVPIAAARVQKVRDIIIALALEGPYLDEVDTMRDLFLYALENNEHNLVTFLLKSGFDPNSDLGLYGITSLMYALPKKQFAMAESLAMHGAKELNPEVLLKLETNFSPFYSRALYDYYNNNILPIIENRKATVDTVLQGNTAEDTEKLIKEFAK